MTKKEPQDALYESIFNLKTLLEWRQMEITISRIISRILGIRMFIVATKHPTFTIKRLINNKLEELEFYYISHPISEIRRKSSIFYETYPGDLNTFIQDVKKYPKKIFFLLLQLMNIEYKIIMDYTFLSFYLVGLFILEDQNLLMGVLIHN